MINDIEIVSSSSRTKLKNSRIIYRKRKNVKGLSFNEILFKTKNGNKKSSYEEHKENKKAIIHKKTEPDNFHNEDRIGAFLDKFC